MDHTSCVRHQGQFRLHRTPRLRIKTSHDLAWRLSHDLHLQRWNSIHHAVLLEAAGTTNYLSSPTSAADKSGVVAFNEDVEDVTREENSFCVVGDFNAKTGTPK
ncbi:unnamed protein product [Strongylus vulgaris]|uniref:Endonuclease/exonuclease/phosphatase domain-containing protein n=1 Tax=Strongylus vulgaris TaxID=40348 RepID=A0A3P7LAN4_STRVU|nr:unnamed protein product [Strongylus vulgaris]